MGILKNWKKILVMLIMIIMLFAIIVLAIFAFKKDYDLNQLTSKYNNLEQVQGDEIKKLQTENDDLSNTLKDVKSSLNLISDDFGVIQGKITPVLNVSEKLSNFQLVCAQNVENLYLKYCKSVSAISQDFNLVLPKGSYTITAQLINEDGQVNQSHLGTYTEQIKCLQDNDSNQDKCSKTSSTPFVIKLESKSKIEKANPVDWKKIK